MTFRLFTTTLFVVCLIVFVNAGDVRNLRNNNAVAALQQHVPEGEENAKTVVDLTRPAFVGANSPVSSILAEKIHELVLLESTKTTQKNDIELIEWGPFGFNCKTNCINEILRNAKMRVLFTGAVNEDGEDEMKEDEGSLSSVIKKLTLDKITELQGDDESEFAFENSALTMETIISDAFTALTAKEDGGIIKMLFVICTEGAYMVINNIMQDFDLQEIVRLLIISLVTDKLTNTLDQHCMIYFF